MSLRYCVFFAHKSAAPWYTRKKSCKNEKKAANSFTKIILEKWQIHNNLIIVKNELGLRDSITQHLLSRQTILHYRAKYATEVSHLLEVILPPGICNNYSNINFQMYQIKSIPSLTYPPYIIHKYDKHSWILTAAVGYSLFSIGCLSCINQYSTLPYTWRQYSKWCKTEIHRRSSYHYMLFTFKSLYGLR